MTDIPCPYCNFDEFDIIHKNDFGAILKCPTPLSDGHSIIVPLRHIHSFFDVSDKERKTLISLIEMARNELKIRHQPDGFHIAFNDGEIEGSLIEKHLHIHIIPRYNGKVLKLNEQSGIL